MSPSLEHVELFDKKLDSLEKIFICENCKKCKCLVQREANSYREVELLQPWCSDHAMIVFGQHPKDLVKMTNCV